MTSPDLPGPRLVELAGKQTEHMLASGEQILGRGTEAHVVVDHDDVSRLHARLMVSDEGIMVEDLDSKNGVFVNGVRITGPTPANDGDRVSLGRVELELIHTAADVRRLLATHGEVTVTRARDDMEVLPPGPGLLLPLVGVAVFGGLVAAMLLL